MKIDKTKLANIIVLPPVNGSVNTLVLHNDYTKEDFIIQLGSDYSPHSDRYSYFEVKQLSYLNFSTGLYSYVLLSDDIETSKGMLKVIDSDVVPVFNIVPDVPKNDDDYKIFKG
jgi:hypothetical protein